MDWFDIIKTFGTAVGAIVTVYIAISRAKKQIKKEISEEISTGNREVKEYTQASFDQLNGLLNAVLESIDYPAWVKMVEKDSDGEVRMVMKYINKEYERKFGISRIDYIGRTDFDVWPKDVAERYYMHDMHVLGKKQNIRFVEPVSEDPSDPDSPKQSMEFEKCYINRGKYEGVMGFMRPPICPIGKTSCVPAEGKACGECKE